MSSKFLRMLPMFQRDIFKEEEVKEEAYIFIEQKLWASNFRHIAGVDEAGRGPLAGPVVAAACILPRQIRFLYVRDSKVLTEEEREQIYKELVSNPKVVWAVGIVDHETIDRVNILRATLMAMGDALNKLSRKPDFVLVDGRDCPPLNIPHQPIIKGDSLSQSIAAASILAKVTRDRIMDEYDTQYPEWGFREHKGYAVPQHLAAIEKFGSSPIHRKTFAPVSRLTPDPSLF
jgi:ribonuclease HII